MKRARLAAALREFFRLGVNTTSFPANIGVFPPGLTADNSAALGLLGFFANMEALDWDFIAVAGGSSTTVTLTAAQFTNNVIDYTGSPAGGVTLNTPTASAILQALPPTIPSGGFNYPLIILNDGAGQTLTLTAGTGVTTVGTMTIATGATRLVIVNCVPSTGLVNVVNCGGWTL